MFGPGFVWLVRENRSPMRFRMLNTYLAGSPHPGAAARRQAHDMNTTTATTTSTATAANAPLPPTSSSSSSTPPPPHYMAQTRLATATQASAAAITGNSAGVGADDRNGYTPVLCVNTWQHVWLTDYGVAGKAEYLRRWWERIDWDLVSKRSKIGNDTY